MAHSDDLYELHALREVVAGNIPEAMSWLQMKVDRQKKALDALNRKVVAQRFVLRTQEELGRGLSREEYLEARNRQPEQLQERIPEEVEV